MIEKADENLADDSAADRAEAVSSTLHISLAQNVVPDLVAGERRLTKAPRHSFARRQTDTLAAYQIPHRERVILFDFTFAGELNR